MTANPVILTMKIMRRGPRAAKGKGGRLLGKAAPGHGTVAKILILINSFAQFTLMLPPLI
jgi:hypothetical protein